MPKKQHPLARYRKRYGLSKAELAKLVELDLSYVSKIERGKQPCGAATAMRLKKALKGKVGVEELVSWGR